MHEALGIIALVPDEWNGIATLRHQVLRRLAQYHHVVWIEPARNWRDFLQPFGPRFLKADRWSKPTPSLEILTPGIQHPIVHRPHWIGTASLRSRLATARKRLIARGCARIALYLWRDEFAAALDLIEHDVSCYHVDDEYTFSDTEVPNSSREIDLLRRVDHVIMHSPALFGKKGGFNEHTALLPSGVDFASFSTPHAEPADMARIPRPRIGYAGVIKRQLDLDLLVRLARARPQWSFVLVGPVTYVKGKEQQMAALRELSNVHFLGAKPLYDLPAYVQHFDVCLMCYELNDYTRYISPLKLNEYLASGRPTVSAPIEAVRDLGSVIAVANDDSEWLAAIEVGLAENDRDGPAAQRRRALARTNDWSVLVEQIARLLAARWEGTA